MYFDQTESCMTHELNGTDVMLGVNHFPLVQEDQTLTILCYFCFSYIYLYYVKMISWWRSHWGLWGWELFASVGCQLYCIIHLRGSLNDFETKSLCFDVICIAWGENTHVSVGLWCFFCLVGWLVVVVFFLRHGLFFCGQHHSCRNPQKTFPPYIWDLCSKSNVSAELYIYNVRFTATFAFIWKPSVKICNCFMFSCLIIIEFVYLDIQ